ncbi:MAG: RNA helicase [Clostridia bacterium]|nr:RNA helicase [Clostridia bacterium]
MAWLNGNNRINVREMMNTASSLNAQLKRILLEEDGILRAVDRAADGMKREAMKQVLEALPVEELNRGRHGIRVSVLHDAGIHNIWQVYTKSLLQLVRLNGIGEQGAKKIWEISKEFADSARESVRIRLRADDPSEAHAQLIDGLYGFMHTAQEREGARRLTDLHGARIEEAVREAAPLTGGLARLFTFGKRRTQAEAAAKYLTELCTGAYIIEAQQTIGRFAQVGRIPHAERQKDFEKHAAAYIAQLEMLLPESETREAEKTGLPKELIEEINAMEVDLSLVKATLRPYQLFGCKYALHQGRVLLGDEMGLGKTVQAIAAMAVTAAEEGITHFMVVCPASVLINWVREIGVHSHLKAVKIHGADEAALNEWLANGGVGVTTYESISRFTLPEGFTVGMLVVDEAHYVKNPEAKRTKAMQVLTGRTDRVLFMSGTPLENKVEEMCFLISLLNEQVAREVRQYTNLATAQQFRQKLAPMYLRRTREDVLTELPDLIENKEWSDLNREEAALYRQAVAEGKFYAMRQVSWQADPAKSSKAQRLMELVEEAKEEKRKVIVFTFFLKTIEKVQALLGERCVGVITGAVPPEERQAMIDRLADAEDGAVLLCQVQAGGTGLNIQAASVIIFCEPQLKPSIEHQAVARAYRMGQVRDVMVHRLLCEDSVDERILEILQEKQLQFDSFADESAAGEEMMKLDEKRMTSDIIRMEQERLGLTGETAEAGEENAASPEKPAPLPEKTETEKKAEEPQAPAAEEAEKTSGPEAEEEPALPMDFDNV